MTEQEGTQVDLELVRERDERHETHVPPALDALKVLGRDLQGLSELFLRLAPLNTNIGYPPPEVPENARGIEPAHGAGPCCDRAPTNTA